MNLRHQFCRVEPPNSKRNKILCQGRSLNKSNARRNTIRLWQLIYLLLASPRMSRLGKKRCGIRSRIVCWWTHHVHLSEKPISFHNNEHRRTKGLRIHRRGKLWSRIVAVKWVVKFLAMRRPPSRQNETHFKITTGALTWAASWIPRCKMLAGQRPVSRSRISIIVHSEPSCKSRQARWT